MCWNEPSWGAVLPQRKDEEMLQNIAILTCLKYIEIGLSVENEVKICIFIIKALAYHKPK